MVPTLFVRWFQIRLTVWIAAQWRSARAIPTPDFCALFEKIELDEPWEPSLPLKYDRMLGDRRGGQPIGGFQPDPLG